MNYCCCNDFHDIVNYNIHRSYIYTCEIYKILNFYLLRCEFIAWSEKEIYRNCQYLDSIPCEIIENL